MPCLPSWTPTANNVILYGLATPVWDAQQHSLGMVFFSTAGTNEPARYRDGAVIDCVISSGNGVGTAFGIGGVIDHMLVRNSDFRGVLYQEPQEALRDFSNIVVESSVFRRYAIGEVFDPVWLPGVTAR